MRKNIARTGIEYAEFKAKSIFVDPFAKVNGKGNKVILTSSANFIKMVVLGRCWPSIGTK
jgi:hypothetical protein